MSDRNGAGVVHEAKRMAVLTVVALALVFYPVTIKVIQAYEWWRDYRAE